MILLLEVMFDTVFFWFDYPPKVEIGSFNEFSNLWDGDIFYVISNPPRSERVLANWGEDYGRAQVVCLYQEADRLLRIKSLIENNQGAIHVLNGFDTRICKEIKPYLFKPGLKALLFTERPAIMGNLLELLLRKIYSRIKYSLLCKEYLKYVRVLLPMGKQGEDVFKKLGFPKDRIYDFMYCPSLVNLSEKRASRVHEPIRFVYVGRFFYKTKGTDTLLKALPLLQGSWTLDLVGGYGSDKDDALEKIRQFDNVRFIGTWDSKWVVKNLQDYDVVVIPSKADGWNLLVNEAFHAGVGVIVSDQAVSHEVVYRHCGGMIFKAGSRKQLAKAMQSVIDNPKIAQTWMENARRAVQFISMKTVGRYLYDIVNFEFYHLGTKPRCPWI